MKWNRRNKEESKFQKCVKRAKYVIKCKEHKRKAKVEWVRPLERKTIKREKRIKSKLVQSTEKRFNDKERISGNFFKKVYI